MECCVSLFSRMEEIGPFRCRVSCFFTCEPYLDEQNPNDFFSRSSDKWQPAGFAKIRSGAQRTAAHDQRRPRGLRPATARWPTARDDPAARWPCPDFSQFFAHAALNPRGGLSMFNGRRWVWICLPFNNLNPCFCLLYVVEIKPWKRFLVLFIRFFTETDSPKEDFHYRTM